MALLLAVIAPPAWAQGVSATARPAANDATEEVRQLRAALAELTQRVQELEKQRSEILKDKAAETAEKDAEEKRAARVEQRLASLEAARPAAGETSGKPEAATSQPLTVTAPFVVQDSNGKAILVVQEDPSPKLGSPVRPLPGGNRGLYIYGPDQSAAIAHVGAINGGGRLYVARPDAKRPGIVVVSTNEDQYIAVNNDNATGQYVKLGRDGLGIFNSSGYAIGEIRSKEGRGLLLVNGADGSHMIEAGSLVNGKGYVLAQPWQNSTTPAGDPSVLMGGNSQ
jgi:hypothetical protein